MAVTLAFWAGAGQAQTASAPAGGLTTGTLASFCAASAGPDVANATAAGVCRGFMVGVGQYHAELTTARGGKPPVYCLPEPSPSFDAAAASFAAWSQANAQYAGEKAIIGLMRWAAASYPCPEQPRTAAPRARR